MISLRRSALIRMTFLLGAVGVVAFVIAYEIARREAADFLDGQLRQIALNAGEGLVETSSPLVKQDPEDEFVIDIWNAAGERLRRPANGITLPRQPKPGFSTISAFGENWRVYLASDGDRTVQAAQRISVRDEMAEAAGIQAGIPILVAIPMAWLVIGWSLGQALGRLAALAQDIAQRGTDRKDPIPTAGMPIEVLPLVEAMNGLTARLQQAIEQQRRFIADAAHELRTPLAALQVQIHNLHTWAAGEQSGPVAEIRDGVRRASVLVDQLLRMARLQEPVEDAARERVDLADLVTQCVADFVPVASAKGVDLGMVDRDPATILGSSSQLKMLFGNLIDNAIRYTPAGGTVDVSVQQSGTAIAVEVVDTGRGVASEDLPRLFDRFFRAAPAEIEGSGLGLSIVEAVAKQHGLHVDIANRTDRCGLRVRVSNSATSAIDLIRS